MIEIILSLNAPLGLSSTFFFHELQGLLGNNGTEMSGCFQVVFSWVVPVGCFVVVLGCH